MFTLRDLSMKIVNSAPLPIGSLLHLNRRPRAYARSLLISCSVTEAKERITLERVTFLPPFAEYPSDLEDRRS
jgi:hypothetical protein